MGNPNLPREPKTLRLEGRELMIAVMGAVAFGIEQGSNADVYEKIESKPEQADQLPPEPA